MKICSVCQKNKSLEDFWKDSSTADGYSYKCRDCKRNYYLSIKTRQKQQISEKICSLCTTLKPVIEFYRSNGNMSGYEPACKKCKYEKYGRYHKKHRNAVQMLIDNAKYRAKRDGLDFNLSINDVEIPAKCPYLNIELFHCSGSMGSNSPTLDRIDSTKGYVQGNVEVISARANMLKSNGTADEHRKIAERMLLLEMIDNNY